MQLDKSVVAYCRVSCQAQVDRGEGMEIQRERILHYCKTEKLKISRFYNDEAVSGAVRDRPELIKLLEDCKAGKIGKVIVYKFDRLARELSVSLWIESVFKRYDVELFAVEDPEIDMNDPLQRAFRRLIDIFAELERSIITSRLRAGRDNNARNGLRGSGPISFGYVKVGDKLEIEQTEAEYVRKIFRWFVRGHRYTEIVSILNKKGIKTKRGKSFQIQSVKSILRNGLYCGEMTYGSISTKGAHESIISKRLFIKAQKARSIATA